VVLPHLDDAQAQLIRAELAYQNHIAASSAYAALPRGPIHADLFRDNVMFQGAGEDLELTGFFDFYFAGVDSWLFDLAVCLNDWCIKLDTGAFDAARVRIGPHAVIESGATLADGVDIGAGCFIGRNASIGAHSKLFANVTVHTGCLLGQRVILHSGVVVGADGFGYEFDKGRHRKVRQAGIVQIDNDVEIGAGTMVDRARFGRTWIGEGTKIDNLVQIAHNVTIGEHCIIVAQVGVAGSTKIGNYVTIAGQVGLAGHLRIGDRAVIAAQSGVMHSIPEGQKWKTK